MYIEGDRNNLVPVVVVVERRLEYNLIVLIASLQAKHDLSLHKVILTGRLDDILVLVVVKEATTTETTGTCLYDICLLVSNGYTCKLCTISQSWKSEPKRTPGIMPLRLLLLS